MTDHPDDHQDEALVRATNPATAQPAARPRGGRLRRAVVIAAVGAAVVVASVVVSQGGRSGPERKKEEVLVDLAGVGSTTTKPFSARTGWTLTWSYDCSDHPDQTSLFVLSVEGPGQLRLVGKLDPKANGVEHYPRSGTFRLVVQSTCTWSLNVTGRRLPAAGR